jgi:hypothetical protein
MTFGVSNLPGAGGALLGAGLSGNGAMAAQNFLNALLGQDDAPKSGGQQFLSDVKDAKNPHEKQALIDGFAEGFAAASGGNQGAQGGNGANGAHHGHRAHHHHHAQGGQGAQGGNGADGAGATQGAGGAQAADGQNGDAGSPQDLMQGFKEIADKVADSPLPKAAKNALLDGIADMMSKLQGQSADQGNAADNAGAPTDGANGGQCGRNDADGSDAQQASAPQANGGTGSTDGSCNGSDQNNGAWTHEVKDGQATIRLGDKYTIKADEKGAEWTVTNNETGKTMKVSGDPHVDTNGDGKNDFDFSKPMSFKLDDGTKITVNTVKGDGDGKPYSSGLTITNGNNAIQVSGLGDKFDGADNLSVTQSNEGRVVDNLTNDGSNTIYENGGAWTTGGGNTVDNAYIERAEAMYG